MKGVMVYAVLIFARAAHPEPGAMPASHAVYLVSAREYAIVETLTFPEEPERLYLRNERFGRYARAQDRNSIVSREYFDSIRNSSRLGSAFRSLLFFNASARGTYPYDPDKDKKTLLTKLGLLGLTAVAFVDASYRARSARTSIKYFTDSSRVRAFKQAQGTFYLSAAVTGGYYLFTALRAHQDFGHSSDGRDLRIPERREIEADEILRNDEAHVSFAKTWSLAW